MNSRFTWDERKRKVNIKTHAFDFQDAVGVFAGPTFTFEDDASATKQRFVTLAYLMAWLNGVAVSLVHTETSEQIHVISFRRATRNEEAILFANLQD